MEAASTDKPTQPEAAVSIAEIEDRREAMKRVIGPLVITFIHEGVASTYETLEDKASSLSESITNGDVNRLVLPWLEDNRDFQTNTEAVWGLVCAMNYFYESDTRTNEALRRTTPFRHNPRKFIFEDVPISQTLTPEQDYLIREHTANMGKGLIGLAEPTIHAQSSITAGMVLTGYIAQKYGCEDGEDLLRVLNTISLAEVIQILGESDFVKSMVSMSFAPNGTYAGSIQDINVPVRIEGKVDAKEEGSLIEEEWSNFDPDNAAIEPFDTSIMSKVKAEEPDTIKGIITKFSIYTIFEKTDDGSIQLDREFVKALRSAVRLTAKYAYYQSEGLGLTIGCPANITQTETQPGDLTDEQLQLMTEGESPAAIYSQEDGVLTMLHNPIIELHQLHVDSLKAFQKLATA